MKQILINILKFLLFLSIGLGILYWVYSSQEEGHQLKMACEAYYPGVDIKDCTPTEEQLASFSLGDKLKEDFAGANYFWVFVSIFAFMLSNISRALRWNMLIKPLGTTPRTINTFFGVMVGYMANVVIPRSGEVFRCGILSRYEKPSADKLLGTVAVSRGLDMICLLVVIGLMLLLQFDLVWEYLRDTMAAREGGGLFSNPLVIGALVVMAVGAVVLFVFRKQLYKIPLVGKLWKIVLGFWEGMLTIRKVDKPFWFVFHTIAIWSLYYLMTYSLFFSYEPTSNLSPVVGLTVFAFGSLGMVIPSPGGIGTYQYLVALCLTSFYGIAEADAFAFSNIAFFPIFFTNIIAGLIALGLFPVVNKKAASTKPTLQGNPT